ncbi:MAG: sulfotransferase family protein [Nitrosomonadaceae bacterium]
MQWYVGVSNPIVTSKPIFIVGMNGSGTTMLLDCLDNHPDIYGFERETKIIPYFIQSAGKYGDLSQDDNFLKMYEDFLNVSFFKYVNNGKKVPLPENWRDVPRSVASVIDGTFNYFAETKGKSRWCEKTPMHAQHISLLAETFPGAKFLHIIRDGRACSASFHRRWGYTPELSVYRWKHIVQEAQRQGNMIPDRYFELHYEDLTSDPEAWMQNICRFLQVHFDPKLITLSRARDFTGSSDTVIVKREEYWQDYLSADKIDALECIAGKTMHRLGYKINNADGDNDPGILRIKYWTYTGNIRLGARIMRNELKYRKNSGKWDDFSGKLINALRQSLTKRF